MIKAQIISATEGVKASELSRQLVLQGLRKEQADALIEQISGNEAITSNTVLTKEQTAAILEQAEARKLLSVEQRQNIANDIEESASSATEATAEMAQASSELAESTIKVGSTSSILARGVSQLGAGMKSLLSIFVSSPTAIIATLTGSIIGLTYVIGKFQDSAKNAAKSASDFASSMSSINSTYNQETQTLNELTEKYQDLREQLIAAKGNEEETYSIKSQMFELQKQLNEIYGDEYDKVNLVTDAYRDQTDELKKNAKQRAENFLNENYDKIEEAKDKLFSENEYELGNFNYGLQDANIGNELHRQIVQLAKDSGIEWDDKKGFVFKGTAEDASKAINQFMTDVTNLKNAQSNLPDSIEENLSAFSSSMSKQLGYADEIIKGYQETYETAQMAQIASDTNLSKGYNQVVDAVEKYNDAVLRSENPYDDENVKKAWDNLQTIKNGIKANEDEWGQYSNIMDDVFSSASDDAYSFYQTMQNDDSVSKLVDDLQGLEDTDLQAMANDGVEDSFDKLCQKANEYGLEVQDVIDLLLQLGVVQGKVEESAPNETSIPFLEAFNSSDFSEYKDKLLELAKSGEITPEVLESTEEYQSLLDKTGLSAEEAKNQITNMLSVQEKLSAASQGMSKLKSAYEEFKDKDIGFVTAETLQSLPDAFKNLPDFDIFEKIVGNPESGKEKIQQAFNDIAKSYLLSQNTLSGLVNAGNVEVQTYIANLKQMGITNAQEMVGQVQQALSEENQLINAAESEFEKAHMDYLNGKAEMDADYLKDTASKNGELASALGSAYQQDYDNWCDLLSQKAEAYNSFVTAIGGSYDESLDVYGNMKANGMTNVNTLDIQNAYDKQNAYLKAQREADKQKNSLKLDLVPTNFNFGYSPGGGTSKSKGGSDSSDTPQTIDWIDKKVQSLNNHLDLTQSKLDNVFNVETPKNLGKKIDAVSKKLQTANANTDKWKNSLSKIKIPDSAKKLIQSGKSVDLSKYSKSEQKNIKKYQTNWKKYSAWSKRTSALEDKQWNLETQKGKEGYLRSQEKDYNTLAKVEDRAYKVYMKKAKSVKLSKSLKEKVRNGDYKISDYSSAVQKNIQEYENWYTKAQESLKGKQEAKKNARDKRSERYQLYIDDADARTNRYETLMDGTTSTGKRISYLKKSKKTISTSYKNKIKQAINDGNYVEASTLRAEWKNALKDNTISQYQERADKADKKVAKSQALAALDEGNYKKQNKHLESQKKSLRESYNWQILIAKKKGDSLEVSRLQAEKEKELRDLTKEEFDNIVNTYDNQVGLNNNKIKAFQDQISLLEAKGQQVGSALYTKQMTLNNLNAEKLTAERDELIKKLDEIPKGTDDWYKAEDTLFSVESELVNIQIENANLQKSINQLKFDRFDDLLEKLNDIVDETNFLKDMLSDNLFDDNGMITDDGVTAMGLTAQNYDVYLAQAEKYKKQIADLKDMYANGDIGDEDYEAKMREYNSGLRDSIKSANDAKKAVIDYVKQGLDAQNDALAEAIDKQKELLSQKQKDKELNKTLADQNKEIARLERQIAVTENDSSDENKKNLRDLRNRLQELKDEQSDTLYDRSISDQEDALDQMLKNSQQQASDYLKNVDVVFLDALDYVNTHSAQVSSNLEKIAKDTGYDISTNITSAWKDGGKAVDSYESILKGNVPKVTSQIQLITSAWKEAALAAEQAAEAMVKATTSEYQKHTGSGSGGSGKTTNPKEDEYNNYQLQKQIGNYLLDNTKDAKGNSKSYSALNQYIYEKTGKILPEDKQAGLAKILGITGVGKNTSADDRAKILKALKAAGFSSGGVIDAKHLIRQTGEDGFALVKHEEAVLTKPEWQSIKDLGIALNNINYPTYKPYIPSFEPRNVQSPVYNIDNSITVDGIATNEIVKDMERVATQKAENVVAKINNMTYAKGVRRK